MKTGYILFMNPPKCNESDYINFLIATQKVFSCTEAGKVQPDTSDAPSHDSVNRLLYRLCPDTDALRNEAGQFADLNKGVLIVDDSTLDKPYSQKIEIVTHHWSGKHHAVVKGINLVTMLWSDGDSHIPCDYRIYYKKADDKTKNNHFRDMLGEAHRSGFSPECVLFDSWYAALENLKYIRSLSWNWLTRLKSNRLINPDGKGNISISSADISETGTRVHLKGYGVIKVFKIVVKDGDIEYWATDNLETDGLRRLQLADYSWRIEEYHRGLKQFCGAERSQVRLAKAQRNHIGLSIRAFLRFEVFSLKTGYSWFEAKTRIIRDAVKNYLANPVYVLSPTA